MIANPVMQKHYSAVVHPVVSLAGALCGLPGIGSGEDFSVKKVDQNILSILHFQYAFALGLDEYILK